VPLTDFNPSLAVTSIAIDRTNAAIMYASTGEGFAASTIGLPGAGIFKSTDFGNTWTQLAATNNREFYWVNKVMIDPNDSNHLYAVTADLNKNGIAFMVANGGGVLYESLDAGATWNLTLVAGDILTDVEVHPDDSNVRLVAGHGTLKVYNSTTGIYDEKISQLNNYAGRVEVGMSRSDQNIMYAVANTEANNADSTSAILGIYKSTNAGVTWNTIWVDPLNSSRIYFGGVDLWRSTDSGVSKTKITDWTLYSGLNQNNISEDIQPHGDHHIIIPGPQYGQLGNRTVYIGNDGGVAKSDAIHSTTSNMGPTSNWDDLVDSSLTITQFYAGDVSAINSKVGGGTQDNSFLIRESGSLYNQFTSGDGTSVIFHPTNSNIVYANTNYNRLWKSIDGGDTFTTVAELGKENAPLISKIDINPQDPDLVYMAGYRLWRYDDNTMTPIPIKLPLTVSPGVPIPSITSIAVDKTARSIWVGYSNGRIEYTTNDGATWSQDVSPSATGSNPVTDIDIKPLGPDGLEIIATFGGYQPHQIYKHQFINNNNIWTDLSLDFDMHVNTVTRHPAQSDWLYVGTDVGIFASIDAGQNWSVYPLHNGNAINYLNNEGPVFTEVTDLKWGFEDFLGDHRLYAFTFGRGIFQSGSILHEAYVDKDYQGTFQRGTEPHPFKVFTTGLDAASNQGTPVIFSGNGTYNEFSGSKIYSEKVLIKTNLPQGQSAIVE